MSNMVDNRLRVTGPTKNLLSFVRCVKGETVLDFNKMWPMPKRIANGNTKNWINWTLENWGSMGNAHALDYGVETPNEELAHIYRTRGMCFETPNAPPKVFITFYAMLSKNLTFTLWYVDIMGGVAGKYTCKGDNEIKINSVYTFWKQRKRFEQIAQGRFGYNVDEWFD